MPRADNLSPPYATRLTAFALLIVSFYCTFLKRSRNITLHFAPVSIFNSARFMTVLIGTAVLAHYNPD